MICIVDVHGLITIIVYTTAYVCAYMYMGRVIIPERVCQDSHEVTLHAHTATLTKLVPLSTAQDCYQGHAGNLTLHVYIISLTEQTKHANGTG